MCPEKNGARLDIYYDYSATAEKVDKKILAERPSGVWKYFEFLPVKNKKNIVPLEAGGTAEAVSDKEILKAQKLLASTEGIFAEPTVVASLAGLIKLVNEGLIKRDEKMVVLITGSRLKDPKAATNQIGIESLRRSVVSG